MVCDAVAEMDEKNTKNKNELEASKSLFLIFRLSCKCLNNKIWPWWESFVSL